MNEVSLLKGALEPTNEPYAVAKIAGLKICESYNRQYSTCYLTIIPTNLYGIHENFHPVNSHVIPGMMHRIHEVKMANLPEV
jgi:GDP-L-fucose synthase